MRAAAALLLLLLALAACGSSRPAGPPEDEILTGLAGSAHRALELDEPESAVRLYGRALARARERDDALMIADMGFGQATASLAAGDARAALQTAREVRRDLARRGRGATPRVALAEATALHRLGRVAEADAVAAEAVAAGAEDPEAALRARFLRGLVAAGRGDVAAVASSRAALAGATQPAFRADALELAGLEALMRGDPRSATEHAAGAATLRRDSLDYRGLSRALALEARARQRLGQDALAADLLLRAGQGAAQRGERADASRWLAEAARLGGAAGRPALVAEARREVAALERR